MAITTPESIIPYFDKLVTFQIHPSQRFPFSLDRVRIESILPASKVDDYAYLHRMTYSTLPPGVLDDPTSYKWLEVRLEDDSIVHIGVPWIIEGSISVIENTLYKVVITDDRVNAEGELRATLVAAGFTNFTITKP